MHRDDLLSEIRTHARLHGRNHARHVVRAVLQALRDIVGEPAVRDLTEQLPPEARPPASGSSPSRDAATTDARASTRLVRDIARQLHVSEPDAAFYARITFEQLNDFCRGVTPAGLAAALPADLRPLLSARLHDPAERYRRHIRQLGGTVATLSLRSTAAPLRRTVDPVARPAVAARRTEAGSPPVSRSAG